MGDTKFDNVTKIIDPKKVSKEFSKNNLLQGTLNVCCSIGSKKKMD